MIEGCPSTHVPNTLNLHVFPRPTYFKSADLSGLLKDLERFQQRSGASGSGPSASSGAPASGVGGAPASSSRPAAGQGAAEEPSPFKEALDKVCSACGAA
jgi:hypothetical protein